MGAGWWSQERRNSHGPRQEAGQRRPNCGRCCPRHLQELLRQPRQESESFSHRWNCCPLRRVNQRYLVATSTKLDISKVSVPENINDKYFARVKAEKSKKEGDIFEAKKEAYKPSEQRKADQAAVDAQVLAAIKGHADGAVLRQYLKAGFSLSKGEFPHKMCF